MYVLVSDDGYFTNLKRRVWILSIGYSLFKKYGVLTFLTLNKKYFYLDKINIITRAVINELRANIARDALIKTSLFIGFAVCCYKAWVSDKRFYHFLTFSQPKWVF
jgi:hypothetical protein